jgi:predicted phage terminase large subunit-like protein
MATRARQRPDSQAVQAMGRWLTTLSEAEFAEVVEAADEDTMTVIEAALSEPELDLVAGRDPALAWRQTPATMAHHLSRGRIKLWRYTVLLGTKFTRAVTGESPRQIWNLPRRYGKSTWASQWGPAWALDRDPTTKLILVSYGDKLATTNALAIRDILRLHRHELRAELRSDQQEKGQFTTRDGGGVVAAGIMSGLTGFGAHGVVFDDPFKDWQEAHSLARRELVDNQYRAVVSSGLETDDAWILIVHTRWHEDDTTARLKQRMEDGTGEAWEIVRIPELAEEYDPDSLDPYLHQPDPLGRAPGEPIEPERFSLATVKGRQLRLGSYLTAALSQQRPSPAEGGEIKRSWWRLEDQAPPGFDDAISSWDFKLKDNEQGDYVVGQYWIRTGSDAWLLDQLRGQWNQATTANAIALMAVRHPGIRRHFCEYTGNAPEVMTELRQAKPGYTLSVEMASQIGMTDNERDAVQRLRRKGMAGLIKATPVGDKATRMRAESGKIEAGNVHILARAPWTGTYLEEMSAFPGPHDDMVDATSQALLKLFGGEASMTSAAHRQMPATPTTTERGPGQARQAGRVMIPRVTSTGRR